MGLLALMLLHESRRAGAYVGHGRDHSPGRAGPRALEPELIAEGIALVDRALASRRFGPYTLQAAIAAVHAEAPSAADDRLGPDRRPL